MWPVGEFAHVRQVVIRQEKVAKRLMCGSGDHETLHGGRMEVSWGSQTLHWLCIDGEDLC